jgi:hypothetical protein
MGDQQGRSQVLPGGQCMADYMEFTYRFHWSLYRVNMKSDRGLLSRASLEIHWRFTRGSLELKGEWATGRAGGFHAKAPRSKGAKLVVKLTYRFIAGLHKVSTGLDRGLFPIGSL